MSKAASYLKVTLEGVFNSLSNNLLEAEKDLKNALTVFTNLSKNMTPLDLKRLRAEAERQIEPTLLNQVSKLVQEKTKEVKAHRLQEPIPTIIAPTPLTSTQTPLAKSTPDIEQADTYIPK